MGRASERRGVQPTIALVRRACRWLVGQAGRDRSRVARRRRYRLARGTPDSHRATECRVPLQRLGRRVRKQGRSVFGPAIAPSSGCDRVEGSFVANLRITKPANDTVHLPGRLQGLGVSKNQYGGPVKCNGWLCLSDSIRVGGAEQCPPPSDRLVNDECCIPSDVKKPFGPSSADAVDRRLEPRISDQGIDNCATKGARSFFTIARGCIRAADQKQLRDCSLELVGAVPGVLRHGCQRIRYLEIGYGVSNRGRLQETTEQVIYSLEIGARCGFEHGIARRLENAEDYAPIRMRRLHQPFHFQQSRIIDRSKI